MKTLFSVGGTQDPQIIRVHKFIREEGIEAITVPLWSPDPSAFAPLTWKWDGGWNFPPSFALWMRNKHRVGPIISTEKQDEWWSVTSTLAFIQAASDLAAISFNSSKRAAAGDSKIAQLETAKMSGFSIPATIVSNERREILDFIAEHVHCIVKPLIAAEIPQIVGDPASGRHLPTTQVTIGDIRSRDPAQFASAPSIYQNLVIKDYELRVIAFNDEIITFKLHSQTRGFTSLDWRAGEALIQCDWIETPDELIQPINAFLSLSGLHSAVFDFAMTPDGEAIFFESNPSGQWARMDALHNFPVSRMFARQMARAMNELAA